MRFDPEKHHRRSIRLKGYDYSQPGYYFVTLCTHGQMEWFGMIKSERMIYSEYGKIADRIWRQIPNHYKNISLDEYIVMPNHIHGIIVIHEPNVGTEHCSVPTKSSKNNYGLLSKIIKSYKETYKKTISKQFEISRFNWQRSFYDHIIRNERSLQNIRHYIINNPLKWEFDNNNPKNWEKRK